MSETVRLTPSQDLSAVDQSPIYTPSPSPVHSENSWGEWFEHRSAYNIDLLIQKQLGQWTLSVPSMRGPYSQTAFERVECADVPQ
jgi:hypothetical protein